MGSKTVAIDWAHVGIGAYGEDLANLVDLSITVNGVARSNVEELREVAFAEYLVGLREAGWNGAETDVRFAYLAHTCVRFTTMWGWLALALPPSEEERARWARLLHTSEETIVDEARLGLDFGLSNGRELLDLLAESG